jgi:hypothetical protein
MPMTQADASRPALDYAPGAPLRRRRRIRRIVALCLLVGTAVAGFLCGPATWSRGKLLYRQRQCLRYAAPAEQVVFDSDPARVAQLSGDPNFVIWRGCAFRKPPVEWQAVLSAARAAGPRPTSTIAMLFLHELKAGGITRLVMVERIAAADESPYFLLGYDVEAASIAPATFRCPQPIEQQFPMAIDVLDSVGPHTDIRIYAGQPDPADPSHFTIRYESGGKTAMANGYLRRDGKVELSANP